jgi:hypothetical protein
MSNIALSDATGGAHDMGILSRKVLKQNGS